jgi:glycosyltransferase involved in cell wall biosynthesis
MIDSAGKNVLVITEVFSPEEFLVNDLVFSWKAEGRSVSVLTRNPSYPKGRIFPGYRNRLFQNEIQNGVPVSRVQFIPGYQSNRMVKILNYLWNMILGMIWAVKNGKKFDAVFICQTGPLTFSSIGILMHKLFGTQTTLWIQDVWPETVFAYGIAKRGITRKILEWFVSSVYSNCDHITVSSPGHVNLLRKYCPSRPIEFVPQWSLTPELTDRERLTNSVTFPGSFNFVFAGNIGKVQNLENTIAGFSLFMEETGNRDVWLNLIGDGSHLQYLQNMVDGKKIRNVKFRGRMKSSEMPFLYDKADVLIISLENKPVFNLTIPAKFQSYLNAGKPIFGILNGEVATLIREHNLGWTADPDNPEEIAGVFREITSCSREALQEKTENATSLLSGRFSRTRSIQRFTELAFSYTSTV